MPVEQAGEEHTDFLTLPGDHEQVPILTEQNSLQSHCTVEQRLVIQMGATIFLRRKQIYSSLSQTTSNSKVDMYIHVQSQHCLFGWLFRSMHTRSHELRVRRMLLAQLRCFPLICQQGRIHSGLMVVVVGQRGVHLREG